MREKRKVSGVVKISDDEEDEGQVIQNEEEEKEEGTLGQSSTVIYKTDTGVGNSSRAGGLADT